MRGISPVDWFKNHQQSPADSSALDPSTNDDDSDSSAPGVVASNSANSPLAPVVPPISQSFAPPPATLSTTPIPNAAIAPGPQAAPTTSLTTTQAGAQITRDNYHWGTTLGQPAGPITVGFRTTAPTSYTVSGENIYGTFSPFTAQEQAAAIAALNLWASAANITFTNLGNSDNATIEFANYYSATDNSEAFSFDPTNGGADTSATGYQGDVYVNRAFASTTNDSPGTYEFEAIIHEIGHAIGLEHPGVYNASSGGSITYANNAAYIQDSRQYSLMSYFRETNTGANYFGMNDETPMLDDIAAVQRLYGANLNTRPGATTYGFNSNAGSPYLITASSQTVVYTVYDSGGVNTFDFSGYSQSATINLNPESFSSVGGLIDNIAIAQNTKIQNAIGGSGEDLFILNPNVKGSLTGGGGRDTFQSTLAGLSGDTITDLGSGDVINFTDANINTFSFNLSGAVLSYGGGYTITLSNDPNGRFTVTADAVSGVDLKFSTSTPRYVPHDFNGDSESDILWRNVNGGAFLWLSNGSGGFTGKDLGIVDNSYQVAATGYFNGDTQSDILWRNTGGDAYLWLSNGSGGFTGKNLGNVDTSYQTVATGDFNGDGSTDVLWRNTGGDVYLWKSDSAGGFSGQDLGVVDLSYQVAGVGDFNGDGKSDILWRNTDGSAVIWQSNSSGGYVVQNLGLVGKDYQVAAVGDFSGDGFSDIMWRNANGGAFEWQSNGKGGFDGKNFGIVDNSYQVASTGDFNGDGNSDILWRNTSGDVFEWQSSGTGGFSGHDFGVVDKNYRIQGA